MAYSSQSTIRLKPQTNSVRRASIVERLVADITRHSKTMSTTTLGPQDLTTKILPFVIDKPKKLKKEIDKTQPREDIRMAGDEIKRVNANLTSK